MLSLFHVKDDVVQNAVCNDGTRAAYYFDSGFGTGEGQWIVHLQGGGNCMSPESCINRGSQGTAINSNRSFNGIFASSETLNPDFHNWNVVHIFYCSADDFFGSQAADVNAPGAFHFRGSDILAAVLTDLQSELDFGSDNLAEATRVILAGSSSGAIAVKHNLDRVAQMLPWADVKGLDDSAYYSLEALGYSADGLLEQLPFVPEVGWGSADRIAYQGLVLDETCLAGEAEDARCQDAMLVAGSYTETPSFVIIDQSDPAMLGAAVDETASREAQIAQSVVDLTNGIGWGFVPDRGQHGWALNSLMYRYRINDVSAMDAFSNWYFDRSGEKLVIEP